MATPSKYPHPTISLPGPTATKFPTGQMKVAIVVKKVKTTMLLKITTPPHQTTFKSTPPPQTDQYQIHSIQKVIHPVNQQRMTRTLTVLHQQASFFSHRSSTLWAMVDHSSSPQWSQATMVDHHISPRWLTCHRLLRSLCQSLLQPPPPTCTRSSHQTQLCYLFAIKNH